jgi:uncharacterized membrane protein
MLNYKYINTLLYFFCFIIGLVACESPQTDNSIYKKIPEEKLDQYCSYLKDPKNTSDSIYMSFCYERYNKLMKEKKIDSAAQILAITGDCLRKVYILDSTFMNTNLSFLEKFGKKIQPKYYSILYSNIGLYYADLGKYDSSTYFLNKSIIPAKDNMTYQNNAYTYYSLIFSHLNNGRLAK